MPKTKKVTRTVVAKRKKTGRAQPPCLPPSDPPAAEVFPNEIFVLILSHFRHIPKQTSTSPYNEQNGLNKGTLAQCMRVSKTFKAIAAPLIYEVLEWKDMQKDPLRIMNEGTVTRRGTTKWLTKNSEAKHVKMVTITMHRSEDCPGARGLTRRGPVELPILRINFDPLDLLIARYGSHVCPLETNLAPRKVILGPNGSEFLTYPQRHGITDVEDLVACLHLLQGQRQIFNLHGDATRLTFILSLAEFDTRSFPTPAARVENIRCNLEHLAAQIADYTSTVASACEITLVNFDASNESCLAGARSSFEPFLNHEIADAKERVERIRLRMGDMPGYKSSVDFEAVTYKFITMREYLATHDWEGVYTQSEVDQILSTDGTEA